MGSRTVIGEYPQHWVYHADEKVMDLSRPEGPDYALPANGSAVRIETSTDAIVASPELSALIIIDMQNFFLSPALGKEPDSAGNKAARVLKEQTVPAARGAGMQVVWLNWGMDDEELRKAPPSLKAHFGGKLASQREPAPAKGSFMASELPRRGIGSEMGKVKLDDGSEVDAGRLLYADQWNTALPPELDETYRAGLETERPDVWIHKNRMSGMWGGKTACTEYLEGRGIKTLFFAGVNTDQCVGGTLQDAFMMGYDVILVKDACGTSSPDFARESWEFNSARTYGFVCDSGAMVSAVERMRDARSG